MKTPNLHILYAHVLLGPILGCVCWFMGYGNFGLIFFTVVFPTAQVLLYDMLRLHKAYRECIKILSSLNLSIKDENVNVHSALMLLFYFDVFLLFFLSSMFLICFWGKFPSIPPNWMVAVCAIYNISFLIVSFLIVKTNKTIKMEVANELLLAKKYF